MDFDALDDLAWEFYLEKYRNDPANLMTPGARFDFAMERVSREKSGKVPPWVSLSFTTGACGVLYLIYVCVSFLYDHALDSTGLLGIKEFLIAVLFMVCGAVGVIIAFLLWVIVAGGLLGMFFPASILAFYYTLKTIGKKLPARSSVRKEVYIGEYLAAKIAEAKKEYERRSKEIEARLKAISDQLNEVLRLKYGICLRCRDRDAPAHFLAAIARADRAIEGLETQRLEIQSAKASIEAFFAENQAILAGTRSELGNLDLVEDLNQAISRSDQSIANARLAVSAAVSNILIRVETLRDGLEESLQGANIALALGAGSSGNLAEDLQTIDASLEQTVNRH